MSPTDVLAVVVPFSLIALGWLALHDTRASRISSRSWRHLGWISCLAAVSVGGFIRFLAAGGALSTSGSDRHARPGHLQRSRRTRRRLSLAEGRPRTVPCSPTKAAT